MADTYAVQREQPIAGPAGAVLERIVDLRRWQSWSPWEGLDPDLRRTYSGADSGVGAVYAWEGNRKAGKGRMEITGVEPDTSVTIDLQFLKPFKSHSTTTFAVRPDDEGVVVRWTMTGRKTFMTRAMGIFTSMDKLIGPDFEKGLAQLKSEVEASASS